MTERRRVHLLLAFLLTLGGFGGVAGAYVAFGPSASSDQPVSDTLLGVGHAEVGSIGSPAYAARAGGHDRTSHQRPGSGRRVGVGGHGRHHHDRPRHGTAHGHPTTDPGPPPTDPIPGADNRLGLQVGDLTGLWPGRAAGLPVTYANPQPFAVRVTKVVVDTPGTKSCGRKYFVTGTYPQAAPVQIRGRSSVSTTVPFGMRRAAPNACQGVAVRVDVTATAVKR